MPHKRAKRSVRDKRREEQKSDLPPVQGFNDDIPKSVARILNAESIQKAFKERKRALGTDGEEIGDGGKKKRKLNNSDDSRKKDKNLKIKPGESLGHFNRRVEDDMRPLVRSAMKNTTSVSKQKASASRRESAQVSAVSKKQGFDDDDATASPVHASNAKSSEKEFVKASSSAPKRLNDIVQAPPELKIAPRLKRLAAAAQKKKPPLTGDDADEDTGGGIVSAAQKRMMELEREKAIQRYRALKEAKMKGLRNV